MAIGGYFRLTYHRLLMAIGGYFIGGIQCCDDLTTQVWSTQQLIIEVPKVQKATKITLEVKH